MNTAPPPHEHPPENIAAAASSSTLKPIYFISGLGADERIFQWLRYDGYRPIHIHWLPPERRESVEHYAHRLAQDIKDKRPIIVGLSFGGIVAIEIAKQIDVRKGGSALQRQAILRNSDLLQALSSLADSSSSSF